MNDVPRQTVVDVEHRPSGPAAPELSQLLDEQQKCWQGGERILVEDLLQRYPALQTNTDSLLDLIYHELMLREERNETFVLEEYLRRFPDLAEPLRLMFEVDDALQFDALLKPTDAPEGPASTVKDSNGPSAPGRPEVMVPGYQILGVLGEGGMGIVYQARQESLNRVVALKMIRGNPGAQELARFRAEAQAVARLEHPNIVHIHEVGEHDGKPFFSLEFINGVNLAAFLEHTPQPGAEAAKLIETLARAVHYAHEQGIVHRDLKPANILLARTIKRIRPLSSPPPESGDKEVREAARRYDFTPKITDFGLAKFVTGEVQQTRTGQVMGTPSYMAPEQAEGRTEVIGPLVDVYALGAILYETLTGRPPFQGTTLLDTLHQVRFDEPVRPGLLRRGCPRDLETICLKCLEKDPQRRYAGALALAEDLQRFRNGQPILARPAGLVERTLKWARRQPGWAALAAALLVLLVGGWWFALALGASEKREREQRGRAEASFGDALEAVDQLLEEVAESDLADVPLMEQVRRNLMRKASGFFQKFLGQCGDDPTVREQAGRVYSRLGDIHDLLNEDEAEQAYDRALVLLRKRVQEAPTAILARRELARTLNNRGALLKKWGRYAAAEQALREALLRRQQLAEFPAPPDFRRDLAETHYYLGALLAPLRGREKEADKEYQQALELQQQLAALPGHPEYRRDLARTCNNWARLLWQTGQQAEARKVFDQAVDAWRQLVQDSPRLPGYRLNLARSLNNRAATLERTAPRNAERGYGEAREILIGLVGDFPTVSLYRQERAAVANNLGRLLRDQRRSGEAEAALRDVLPQRAKLARDFPKIPDYRQKWAKTLQDLGSLLHDSRPWEAERAYRESLDVQARLVVDFPDNVEYDAALVLTLEKLARLLLKRGKLGEPYQALQLVVPSIGAPWSNDLMPLGQAHAALVEATACLHLAIEHRQIDLPAPAARRDLTRLYLVLADIGVRLGQHARVAAVAEQMPRVSSDEPDEYLRAAQFLIKCVVLVGEDTQLAPMQRRVLKDAYGRKAVEMLRQAAAKGFKNGDDLRKPIYDPLRQREDFNKLLQELENSKQDIAIQIPERRAGGVSPLLAVANRGLTPPARPQRECL